MLASDIAAARELWAAGRGVEVAEGTVPRRSRGISLRNPGLSTVATNEQATSSARCSWARRPARLRLSPRRGALPARPGHRSRDHGALARRVEGSGGAARVAAGRADNEGGQKFGCAKGGKTCRSRSRWIRSMRAPAAPVPIAADKTEQLWREFAAPLRSFLRARTKSDADAEIYAGDLRPHPEAAADAARHVEDPGWVYRIARNASSITTGRGASTCRWTSSWRRRIPRASARRPAAQPATLHRRASPSYREPLVRHEFQGESLEEVAAALALTLTATKAACGGRD